MQSGMSVRVKIKLCCEYSFNQQYNNRIKGEWPLLATKFTIHFPGQFQIRYGAIVSRIPIINHL